LKGTIVGYLCGWFDEIRYCIGFPANAKLASGIMLQMPQHNEITAAPVATGL
jgi:hypothetical protein